MAVAFVQKAITTASGSPLSVNINGVTAGNLLLVGLVTDGNPDALVVTDGSNTYLRTPSSPSKNFGGSAFIFYAVNVIGGNLTVTTTWGSGVITHSLWVREFSGFGVGGFNADATGTGSGTTINVPSVRNASGDLLYAVSYTAGAISATGSPWAAADSNIQNGEADEYKLSSSGGTQAVNWASSNAQWSAVAASFTPGAAATAGHIQLEGGTGNVELDNLSGDIALEY